MSNLLEDVKSSTSNRPSVKRLSMAVILGVLAAFVPLSIDMYLPALAGVGSILSYMFLVPRKQRTPRKNSISL